ncbi:hypothetical protein, partial [Salmonella sp. SAL4446]|uniref:hypothetical protein n=1 Tax=Salmonella sp. SAL4446 TaxID=3159901 RepID=UPI00397D995F
MGWLVATLAFDYFLTAGLGAVAKALPALEKLFLGLKAVAESMDAVLGALLVPLTKLAGLADEALAGLGAALKSI